MSGIEASALLLVVVVLLAWHLSYTAARLHRLHTRVEGTLAALDAALVRRAEAALEAATGGAFDPAGALVVVDAATRCLDASPDGFDARDWIEAPLPAREVAEADLGRALAAATDPDAPETGRDPLLARLADARRRVVLAARFHDDAVADVRWLRARPTVRLFRLAGHAALPRPLAVADLPQRD